MAHLRLLILPQCDINYGAGTLAVGHTNSYHEMVPYQCGIRHRETRCIFITHYNTQLPHGIPCLLRGLVVGEEVTCMVFNGEQVVCAGPHFVAPPGGGEILTSGPSGDNHEAPVCHIRLYVHLKLQKKTHTTHIGFECAGSPSQEHVFEVTLLLELTKVGRLQLVAERGAVECLHYLRHLLPVLGCRLCLLTVPEGVHQVVAELSSAEQILSLLRFTLINI